MVTQANVNINLRKSTYEDEKELKNVKYIIGIDGGGTKTEAVAYSKDGEQIARGYAGFGNIVVNQQQGLKNIEMAILECIRKLNINDCIHIYAGIAGIEVGNNKEIIEKYLKSKFNTSITVINDADLAFNALLKGEDGILTISGTGSISFGIHNNKYFRAGGWGNILGDEGSGYDISLKALKKIVSEKDDNLEASDLSKEILKYINASNVFDMVKFVHNSNKADIANLVPIIVQSAKKNNEFAINLLDEAGKDLAAITIKVYRALQFSSKVKICVMGSIFTKIPIVKKNYTKYLSEKIKNFEIIDENISPAKGGYYLAVKKSEF